MKAVQINRYGGYEVLEVNDVAEPVPGAGQVLVEVYASSINPFDSYLIQGYLKDKMTLPVTLGGDFSGVIRETGQAVYGTALFLTGGSGAFANVATANIKNISDKPKNLDFNQAASLPLVGASSIQALIDTLKLKSGQKILIHGGAGGIGSLSIQLAKALGATVATTASTKDQDFVQALGADLVIDYQKENFEKLLKDYDAVFDTVGDKILEKSFLVLKKGGSLASMKGQPDPKLCQQYGVSGFAIMTQITSDRLKKLTAFVESGKLKPQVGKIFPLEQIKEAFGYKQLAHPRGKVVIRIK